MLAWWPRLLHIMTHTFLTYCHLLYSWGLLSLDPSRQKEEIPRVWSKACHKQQAFNLQEHSHMATLKRPKESETRGLDLYLGRRMRNTKLCWINRGFSTLLFILQSRQMLSLSKRVRVCVGGVYVAVNRQCYLCFSVGEVCGVAVTRPALPMLLFLCANDFMSVYPLWFERNVPQREWHY